jgi:hypothetical protein
MTRIAFLITALIGLPAAAAAEMIPYFARQYGVSCAQCHVAPPKLNEFGQAFLSRGYEMPGLESRGTWPFAIWASGRADRLNLTEPQRTGLVTYLNRLEVISGGSLGAPWLSYFVEWRALSLEPRGDGTLRDRSGRFEDLFVVASTDRLELMAGQFRQIAQIDVSQRASVSEPLALAASLPGAGDGSAREVSLRGFSPSGRSPAARLGWTGEVGRWGWTTSLTLPLPGELSLPLTREARAEASNEVEWRLKGVVVESYVRRGLTTWGGHVFSDGGDRFLANLVTTGSRASLHWAAVAGVDRVDDDWRRRTSVEAELYPDRLWGVGARLEDRTGDGAGPALLPYLNAHFPGTRHTFRLTVEQRFQQGRRGVTLVELGTVF